MELTLDQALQKGIEAHKAGKVEEADRYYTAILKAQPKHPDANHNMGVLAVGLGKVEQALPFFKTALEANPNIAQYWLSYIDTLIKLDQSDEAKAMFDKAKSNGAKGDGFDKLEEQIRLSSSKTSNTQEPPQEQLQALITQHSQGQYQEALDEASKLLLEFPSSVNLYNIIGATNQGLGRLNEAIDAFKKAISLKPNFAEAYSNMGVALQKNSKPEEAIEAYEKAIAIKPNYAEAYNNMGIALTDQGKPKDAIKAYKKAVSIKPDYAEAYDNMGILLKALGSLDEAIETYKKILAINPDHGGAKHMLSALTGTTLKTAPREYVENLFDRSAYKFEALLVRDLEYVTPKLIKDVLLKSSSNESLGSILDLGCGTGLLGSEIKDHCSKLEGIDLSNNMLEIAARKNVYDSLSQSDIVEYLSSVHLDFDYYIALDVFIYVGDLSEIFHLIKSRNRKSGKFVFSTEHTELDGYHILKTGRYSHSKNYVESLCNKFDYKISHYSTIDLRKEKGDFLTGGIYILEFENGV